MGIWIGEKITSFTNKLKRYTDLKQELYFQTSWMVDLLDHLGLLENGSFHYHEETLPVMCSHHSCNHLSDELHLPHPFQSTEIFAYNKQQKVHRHMWCQKLLVFTVWIKNYFCYQWYSCKRSAYKISTVHELYNVPYYSRKIHAFLTLKSRKIINCMFHLAKK